MNGAFGTLLAVGAAACFGIGLPLQTRRARVLPDLGTAPARAVLAFLRDARWLAASALVLAGWGLELVALAHAPVAIVFPVAAAGIAAVGVLSARWFGERLSRAEWAGVVVTLIGIASGAASADGAHREAQRIDFTILAAAAAALLLTAAAASALGRGGRGRVLLASGSSGLLFAGSGLLTKAFGVALDSSAGFLLEAGLLAALVLFAAGGAFALQVAVQRGSATVAAAWSGAISSLLPGLLAGPVFGEAWPEGARGAERAGAVVALGVGCLLLLGPPRRPQPPSVRSAAGTSVPAGAHDQDIRTSR